MLPALQSLPHTRICRCPSHMSVDLLIALISATALLGLAISPDRALSLNRLSLLLLGVVSFQVIAALTRKRGGIIRSAILLILLGVGVAVFSLIVTNWSLGILVPIPALYERIPLLIPGLPGSGVPHHGEGVNPRVVAGAMAVFLPLAAALAVHGSRFRVRLFGALSTLVIAFPLFLSQSPQGFLGVGLGMAVVLFWNRPKAALALVPLAVGLAWAWWAHRWWLPPALAQRLTMGLLARIRIWEGAVAILRDVPFTGLGLNAFPAVYPFYTLPPAITPHAHNTFLQTWADMGAVGLVAFCALFAISFITAVRVYCALEAPDARAGMVGAAGSIVAYLGYGLLDTMTLGYKAAPGLWAILGLVAGAGRVAHLPPLRVPRKVRIAVLAAMGALAVACAPITASALLTNGAALLAHPAWAGPDPGPQRLALASDLAWWATRLWAGNGRAYALLGRIALMQGDNAAAFTALEQAVRLDPADRIGHLSLGDLYLARGDESRAIAHWRAARAGEILVRRASEARQHEQMQEALTWYRLAVAVDPNNDPALRGLANLLRATGELEAAFSTWETYVRRFPTQPWGYVGQAEILLWQDCAGDARAVLEQGLAQIGPEATLYLLLARAYEAQGDLEAALEAASQAVALRADYWAAWYRLGSLYEKQGCPEEALQAYLRAAGEREDYWAWVGLRAAGRLLLSQGRPGDAVERLSRAVLIGEVLGEDPSAVAQDYVLLGDALAASGRETEAMEAYRTALELDPGNEAAQTGLTQIRWEP